MHRAHHRAIFALLAALAIMSQALCARGQAALLMEEPYGFFGMLNPTGHTAIYFARICADTPVKLRRCEAGEQGSVISRYQGIAGYDWVAMPLIPYLYSVDKATAVPLRVDKKMVQRLRNHYYEQHIENVFGHVYKGNLVRGGWTQLVGVAYERRIYAFRFATTAEQDDAIIARLNNSKNVSDFGLLYSNCADFARTILNSYFPRTFRRTIFPDMGMTTPRQITWKLVRYAKAHPETDLEVMEIPQIPGYRRMSKHNKSVAASLITTGYAIPITLMNPYLAGGIFVDYLVRGRYPLIPEHPEMLEPDHMDALTDVTLPLETASGTGAQPAAIVAEGSSAASAAHPAMKEAISTHE